MTNEEIGKELTAVSKRISDLSNQKNWYERNLLVPYYRELYNQYDFGFAVGEEVLTPVWQPRTLKAKIVEHTIDNYFFLRNELGWEMLVPGNLIKKLDHRTADRTFSSEQILLFN